MLLILSHMTKLLEWHYLPYWHFFAKKTQILRDSNPDLSHFTCTFNRSARTPRHFREKLRIYKVNCKDLSNLHSNYYCQCHNVLHLLTCHYMSGILSFSIGLMWYKVKSGAKWLTSCDINICRCSGTIFRSSNHVVFMKWRRSFVCYKVK